MRPYVVIYDFCLLLLLHAIFITSSSEAAAAAANLIAGVNCSLTYGPLPRLSRFRKLRIEPYETGTDWPK